MISITFNENQHLGWQPPTEEQLDLILRGVAFIIYLEPRGSHHFEDGEFPLLTPPTVPNTNHVQRFQRNKSFRPTTTGPILFAMQTPVIPTLLFKTNEHYIVNDRPLSLNLMECDLQFFDREATRELVTNLSKQPPSALVPFSLILFQIAHDTEQERLRLV